MGRLGNISVWIFLIFSELSKTFDTRSFVVLVSQIGNVVFFLRVGVFVGGKQSILDFQKQKKKHFQKFDFVFSMCIFFRISGIWIRFSVCLGNNLGRRFFKFLPLDFSKVFVADFF